MIKPKFLIAFCLDYLDRLCRFWGHGFCELLGQIFMLIAVLISNLLIAGFCWYLIWRILQLRQTLANITAALTIAEHQTHAILQGAPATVQQGQSKTSQLRRQYRQLLIKMQQLQQIIVLLQFGQMWRLGQLWRRSARRSVAPRLIGTRDGRPQNGKTRR